MNTAVITLCTQGARVARRLSATLGDCTVYVHNAVAARKEEEQFVAILPLTARIFRHYRNLVFIAPCGVAVRAIAPLVGNKRTDPAVVVVDVGRRWAISLLCGHEGGANALALAVGNALDAEPVITTTTEAAKTLVVGVGCRRGTPAATLVAAIREGLDLVGAALGEVRYIASAQIKADEAGLIEAGAHLGIPVRFIASEAILSTTRRFKSSAFVASKVHLPAVAEPSALLAGTRTTCILGKTIIRGTTIAIARENCL
jgi:cobalt-precorrin 5A hydrolase